MKRNVLIILYITLVIIVAVSGIWIYNEYKSRKAADELRALADEAESEMRPELSDTDRARYTHLPDIDTSKIKKTGSNDGERQVLPRIKSLYEQNPEIAGWLTIPGTEISYPVMYRKDDNDFYLKHNFYGEDDINGCLVLDKRCESDGSGINNLIHGHNMKSGAMFGKLKNYQEASYYREHKEIVFSTLYKEKKYEIFAVFKSTVYNDNTNDLQYYNYIDIENEEQFNDYVKSAKEQSLYDTGVDAEWGEQLITLSTCEYTKENGRLVIVAREI